MSTLTIPPAFAPFLLENIATKEAYGGRGGAKSESLAAIALIKAMERKRRILCAREIQNSIQESVYALLKRKIDENNLAGFYATKTSIEHRNGSVFLFHGLREQTTASIKSYDDVDICWVEEAQSVSQNSLDILIPTIRKEGSEIWYSYNRLAENDPVYAHNKNLVGVYEEKRFRCDDGTVVRWKEARGNNAVSVFINHDGNPFFTGNLRDKMLALKEADYDRYLHVWEGEPLSQLDKAVIPRTLVREAMTRVVDDEGSYVLGADIARYGDDRTQIYLRRGLKIVDEKTLKKTSTVNVARAIDEMLRKHISDDPVNFFARLKTLIRIDDTGVGGGVTDYLRDTLKYRNVDAVNFGESAYDKDAFANLISEMWCEAPQWLSQSSIPDDGELLDELTGRLYSYDSKERRVIEPKDAYKKRARKSPDKADALLLCFSQRRSVNRDFGDAKIEFV